MPMYLCRWPDGSFSVVKARSREDAIEKLDEVANAEGCPLYVLREFQAHFNLNPRGEIALDSYPFGGETEAAIMERCYPVLNDTLIAIHQGNEHRKSEKPTPDQRRRIRQAIGAERKRVTAKAGPPPDTEAGKEIKKLRGMPTSLGNGC